MSARRTRRRESEAERVARYKTLPCWTMVTGKRACAAADRCDFSHNPVVIAAERKRRAQKKKHKTCRSPLDPCSTRSKRRRLDRSTPEQEASIKADVDGEVKEASHRARRHANECSSPNPNDGSVFEPLLLLANASARDQLSRAEADAGGLASSCDERKGQVDVLPNEPEQNELDSAHGIMDKGVCQRLVEWIALQVWNG